MFIAWNCSEIRIQEVQDDFNAIINITVLDDFNAIINITVLDDFNAIINITVFLRPQSILIAQDTHTKIMFTIDKWNKDTLDEL